MVKTIQKTTVSRAPRKQRKALFTADSNERYNRMCVAMSKELKAKYGGLSTMPVKVGDIVKVTTGQFKDRKGKVKQVKRGKYKILIEKITQDNARQAKKEYPIHPSNCVLTKLNMEHKRKDLISKRIKRKRGLALNKKIKEDEMMKAEEDEVKKEKKNEKKDEKIEDEKMTDDIPKLVEDSKKD